MFKLIKWLFFSILSLLLSVVHAIAEVIVFTARWVLIACIFTIAAMLVVHYAYSLVYTGTPTKYEYRSFIEGKVGELGGEMKAALVRFDVSDEGTVIQTKAFLTPEQVVDLEGLPTLTFTETAPGCYTIKELGITTKSM